MSKTYDKLYQMAQQATAKQPTTTYDKLYQMAQQATNGAGAAGAPKKESVKAPTISTPKEALHQVSEKLGNKDFTAPKGVTPFTVEDTSKANRAKVKAVDDLWNRGTKQTVPTKEGKEPASQKKATPITVKPEAYPGQRRDQWNAGEAMWERGSRTNAVEKAEEPKAEKKKAEIDPYAGYMVDPVSEANMRNPKPLVKDLTDETGHIPVEEQKQQLRNTRYEVMKAQLQSEHDRLERELKELQANAGYATDPMSAALYQQDEDKLTGRLHELDSQIDRRAKRQSYTGEERLGLDKQGPAVGDAVNSAVGAVKNFVSTNPVVNTVREYAQTVTDRLVGTRDQINGMWNGADAKGKFDIIGKVFWGDLFEGSARFNKGLSSVAKFLFGGVVDELHALTQESVNLGASITDTALGTDIGRVDLGDNVLERADDYLSSNLEMLQKAYEPYFNSSRGTQWAHFIGSETARQIPSLVLGVATNAVAASAATSEGLAALSAKEAAVSIPYYNPTFQSEALKGLPAAVANGVSKLVNDPQFTTAWISALDESLSDAEENGLDKQQTMIYSVINSVWNAMLEVGGVDEALGGVQGFMKSAGKGLRDSARSIIQEGTEEVEQGSFGRYLMGVIKGDAQLFSLDPNDTDAAFNPTTNLSEFVGGAAVAAGMTSAQNVINTADYGAKKGAYSAINAIYKHNYKKAASQFIDSAMGEMVTNVEAKKVLVDGYSTTESDPVFYAKGVEDTMKLAKMGLEPEQIREVSTFAAALSETQFNHAYELTKSGQSAVDIPDTYSPSEKPLERYENIESYSATFQNDAAKVTEIYDMAPETNVNDFAQGFQKAYDMGRVGVAGKYLERVADLSAEQAKAAYALGSEEAWKQAKSSAPVLNAPGKTGKRGTVTAEPGVKLLTMYRNFNDSQRVGFQMLSGFARATGINIRLYESQFDADGKNLSPNGWFDPVTNTIHIDINSGVNQQSEVGDLSRYVMHQTLAHELTHFTEKWNAEAYYGLRQAVLGMMEQKGTDVNALIEETIARNQAVGNTLDYEGASREVVAEAMSDMFQDSSFVERLANQNPTLAQKVLARLRAIRDQFKALIQRTRGMQPREAQLLQENGKYLDELVSLWEETVQGAVANYKGSTAEAKVEQTASRVEQAASRVAENGSKAEAKPEEHIDQRSFEDVADRKMNAFQFDHPELRPFFKQAAEQLRKEIEIAESAAYMGTGKNVYRGPYKRLYNYGMSKPRILECLDAIIHDHGQENFADAKRVEIVLDQMLSERWGGMGATGEWHEPNQAYLEAKQKIAGASGEYGDTSLDALWEPGKQFSVRKDDKVTMQSPVVGTKNLLAIHNMTEAKVLSTLKLGAWPSPSIAIVEAKQGHSQFGEFSALFRRESIDPAQDRRNKLYGSDAWTPAAARVDYEVNTKAARKFENKLYDLSRKYGDGRLANTSTLRSAGVGEHSLMTVEELAKKLSINKTVKAAYVIEHGIDMEAEMKAIGFDGADYRGALDWLVDDGDVQKWLEGELSEVIGAPGVYNGKEPYTDNGNMRSFKALHMPYTAENIVKAMGKQEKRGAGAGANAQGLQSVMSKEYKSVDKMKQDSGKLERMDSDEYRKLLNGIDDRVLAVMNDVFGENNGRSFYDIGETVLDAARAGGTPAKIVSVFARDGLRISNENVKALAGIFKDAGQLPTDYFEAKPQRVVNFGEAVVVAAPDNTSEALLDQMIKAGMNVVTYEAGNNADRLRALNEQGVQFSLRPGAREEVHKALTDKNYRDDVHLTDSSPAIIVAQKGARNLPMVMKASHIRENVFTAEEAKQHGFQVKEGDHYHGLGEELYLNVIDGLDDVTLAYRGTKNADDPTRRENYFLLISQQKDSNGNTINVPVYINAQGQVNRVIVDTNKIATVFGRDNYRAYLDRQVQKGNLIRIKKRSTQASERTALIAGGYSKDASHPQTAFQQRGSEVAQASEITDQKSGHYGENSSDTSILDAGTNVNEESQLQIRRTAMSDEQLLTHLVDTMGAPSTKLTAEEQRKLKVYRHYREQLDKSQKARAALGSKLHEQYRKSLKNTPEIAQTKAEIKRAEAAISYNEQHLEAIRTDGVIDKLINKARRQFDAEMEAKSKRELKEYREIEKLKRDELRDRLTQEGRERLTNYRNKRNESEAVRHYREQVAKRVKELRELFLHPSTKDIKKHIPKQLEGPLMGFLESIDLSSKRLLDGGEMTKADARVLAQMHAVREALNTSLDEGGLDLPPDFKESFDGMIGVVTQMLNDSDGSFVVNRMNSAQLKELSRQLKVLKKAVTSINVLHNNGRFAHVAEAGHADFSFLGSFRRNTKSSEAARFINFDYIRPTRILTRMGEGAKSIGMELRQGQATEAFLTKEILDFKEKTFTDKEAEAWGKEVHTFKLENGESVTMTSTQLMSLYCLSKRKQAQSHIYGQGISVGTFKDGKVTLTDDGHQVTLKDVGTMLEALTERQKTVADALQKFMNTEAASWGNYVSMARFDVEMFTEENYFPISVDKNALPAQGVEEGKGNDLYALLNMGFTKELKENASERVKLFNVFDVFGNHVADMAQYRAFALPVLDAVKWFNYRDASGLTLRDQMDKAFGVNEKGVGYAQTAIKNLLKAYNSKEAQGQKYDSLGMKWLSRFNGSRVAWNLRVVVQQPTAIARAAMVINGKYLTAAVAQQGNLKADIAEMEANSGIALWKSYGFFDTNISRNIVDMIRPNDDSKIEKARQTFTDVGLTGAEWGDKITWATMWRAAKMQVAAEAKAKGQTLTQEQLLAKTTELFEDCIYDTQVVDSVLTKSEFLRSKSIVARTFGSFMSEASATVSMVQDVFLGYSDDMARGMSRQAAWVKHKGKIAKVMTVYTVTEILNTIAQSLIDGLFRDDDDYESKWEKVWSAFKTNFIENLMPFGKIPGASELFDAFKWLLDKVGAMKPINRTLGTDFYGQLDGGELVKSGKYVDKFVTTLVDLVEKGEKSKYSGWRALYSGLQLLGVTSGFAVDNIYRSGVNLWNASAAELNPALKIRQMNNDEKTRIKYAYLDGNLDAEKAIDLLVEKEEAKNQNEAYWMVQGWDGASKYDEVKETALAGDLTAFANAMDVLTEHGVKQKDAQSKVKNFVKAVYTGEFQSEKDEEIAGDTKLSDGQAKNILVRFAGLNSEEADDYISDMKFYLKNGYYYDNRKSAYLNGEISRTQVKNALMGAGNMTAEEAEAQIAAWEWNEKYHYSGEVSSSMISYYNEFCKDAGVSAQTYLDVKEFSRKNPNDKNEKGQSIAYSGAKKVAQYINSLNLTREQKEALAQAMGWKSKTLKKVRLW